eukprot:UN01323
MAVWDTRTKNSIWENEIYKLIITFPNNYPKEEPGFCFRPVLFHPNISRHGHPNVWASTVLPWESSLTIEEMLLFLQKT